MDMTNCIRKGSVIVINLQRNFFSKNQKHKTLQCSGTLLEEFFSAALYIFFPTLPELRVGSLFCSWRVVGRGIIPVKNLHIGYWLKPCAV